MHLIGHGRYKGEGYPAAPRSSGSGAPLTSYAGPAAAIIYPPGYADLLCTDVLGGTVLEVPLAPFTVGAVLEVVQSFALSNVDEPQVNIGLCNIAAVMFDGATNRLIGGGSLLTPQMPGDLYGAQLSSCFAFVKPADAVALRWFFNTAGSSVFISTPTDTTTTAPAQVVVREIPADRVLVLPNNAIAP
mgnify:FL=1